MVVSSSVLVASRGAVGARGFAENGFSGKFHPAFIVDPDALDFDQVAHLDGVVDAFDPTFGQLRNMNQAVARRGRFRQRRRNP